MAAGGEARCGSGPGALGACAGRGAAGGERAPGPPPGWTVPRRRGGASGGSTPDGPPISPPEHRAAP